MKKLSTFDLIMIIIFVVVGLLGGGVWWYLSGLLQTAQQDDSAAQQDFDRYSSKEIYLPTASNLKVLQANIELLKAQLDPLVSSKLQPEKSALLSIANEDTVAWKHDLDAETLSLNASAKQHLVAVPNNFYYGFSRYLSTAPGEEKTAVLSKQLLAIKEIATILINAPVKSIQTMRRTYEEDATSATATPGGRSADNNVLAGSAVNAAGGVYTAYPFEVEFEATTSNLRKVMNDLTQSSDIFVVRSMTILNSQTKSPQISDLDKMAPPPAPTEAVGDSSPGAAAEANTSVKGPQFLFGNEILHIKMRIDLIEWKGTSSETAPASGQERPRGRASTNGGNP